MNRDSITSRRDFMVSAGTALAATAVSGNVRGANDRIAAAFIGAGVMGTGNLQTAMKHPGLEVAAVFDC